MDTRIIAVYCIYVDLLNMLGHVEGRQPQMTDAEVVTTALVAALHLGGNFEVARAAG